MPTILSHAAVPLALRLGLGGKAVPARLLACGAIASMLPDLDVVGMRLGVAYASDFGHRGFTHSLLFAAVLALGGACFYRRLRTGSWAPFYFCSQPWLLTGCSTRSPTAAGASNCSGHGR